MKLLFIVLNIFIFIDICFAEDNTTSKITKYEVSQTLDMLGGKDKIMQGAKELAEKKYYLANQIILWERSPKVQNYSDLDNKKMILDLKVINQRINKETYSKNIITFNEYNIEFIGTKDEINKFLSALFFDNQEAYSLNNVINYIEIKQKKFNFEKDILFEHEAFVKYRIHKLQEDNQLYKLYVNLH